MKPTIKRLCSDLVEIKINEKIYHVISDDTPILGFNKFILSRDGKYIPISITDNEKKSIFIKYNEFRQKEEFEG